jgi:hypothetical protein
MSDYRAYLSNCLIGGELITETGNRSVRNLIRLQLDGMDLEIIQHPELIAEQGLRDIDGQKIDSIEILIRNLQQEDLSRVRELILDISWLLTFACASQVRKCGESFNGDRNWNWFSGTARCHKPVIDIRNGKTVREFLEQTWNKYRNLKDERQLNVVFDYLALSQTAGASAEMLPLELQLMISFVTLENLKGTFAKSKKIPFIKKYFRKISVPPKANPKKEKKYEFKELLEMMLDEVGVKSPTKEVYDLRNEIIHSGISQMLLADQRKILNASQDVIREYLLRLLGYKGQYAKFSEPNRQVVI